MPSSMIHFNIALMLADKLNIKKEEYPQYLLGAVSPDAVNAGVSQAPKEKRYPAHIRSPDLKEWEKNVLLYYEKNKAYPDKAFMLGFVVHVLTDIKWDELIQPDMLRKLKVIVPNEDLKKLKWHTLKAFDNMLLKRENTKLIISSLKAADTDRCISTVDEKMLDAYRDELVSELENEKSQGDTDTVLDESCLEIVANSVLNSITLKVSAE